MGDQNIFVEPSHSKCTGGGGGGGGGGNGTGIKKKNVTSNFACIDSSKQTQ